MKLKYPDYKNSLLSISSSVLVHYGAQALHPTLPEFDALLAKNYKNVVVMLFDGLGTAILEKHLPEDSFLRRNLKSTLSSVFPPTTTAATVSIETGLSPIEHGWLGWSLYFNEIGANVSIFPNTLSGSDGIPAADFHVAKRYIPYKNIIQKIREAGNADAYYISPFSEYRAQSVSEICEIVNSLCSDTGRKYIYSYWYKPDYDMHELGTLHKNITALIQNINNSVETLCDSLSDTLVIVTADHGLVDTERRYISDYPDVEECLLRMPSIEARAMSFFIKPGMSEQFESSFIQHFGDCYKIFSKEQVISEKLFGDGKPHPHSEGFIGDYLAVAFGNVRIECSPSQTHDVFKASHAGMTEDEMNIPFIAVECK